MQGKHIVNVISQPGGGKTTAASIANIEFGYELVRPSAIIEQYAKSTLTQLNTRSDYLRVYKEMRSVNPDIFVSQAQESSSSRVAYDGLRVPVDISRLRIIGNYLTVAVLCPPHMRFANINKRREIQCLAPLSRERFDQEEFEESYSENLAMPSVQTIIEGADRVIKNFGTEEEYREAVRETFREITPN
jgi:dephospho-CoA kinase